MKKFKKEIIEAVDYVLNNKEWSYTKESMLISHFKIKNKLDSFICWDKDTSETNLLNDLSEEDLIIILFGEYEIEKSNLELLEELKKENKNKFYKSNSNSKEYYESLGFMKAFELIDGLNLSILEKGNK